MTQTIELDCAPGWPRPDDLIDDVIKDTGLEKREPMSKFFGNWTWDYSDVDPEQWQRVNGVIAGRIKQLYYNGSIRYGSW